MSNDPAKRAAQRIAKSNPPLTRVGMADIIRAEFSGLLKQAHEREDLIDRSWNTCKEQLKNALERLELMPCGHPRACLTISAETGEPLYCGWCNAVSIARDAMTDKLPCGHEKACQFPDLKKCTACEREAAAVAGAYEAAALAALEQRCERNTHYDEACLNIASSIHYYDEACLNIVSSIRALTPADAQRALDRRVNEARVATTEQCAIEAGERSPEGVSSHTKLGDVWDKRIAKLKAALGESK